MQERCGWCGASTIWGSRITLARSWQELFGPAEFGEGFRGAGSGYVLGLSCVKDSTVRSSGDPGRLAAIEPRHTVLPRPAARVLCYSTAGAGDRQVPQRVHAVEKCHGCALLSPACPGHLEAENVVGSH